MIRWITEKIYHGNPTHFTTDGGNTFIGATGDHHALWINPSDPNHFIWADDGGVNQGWYAPEYASHSLSMNGEKKICYSGS